jgi:hypothetical protein
MTAGCFRGGAYRGFGQIANQTGNGYGKRGKEGGLRVADTVEKRMNARVRARVAAAVHPALSGSKFDRQIAHVIAPKSGGVPLSLKIT